MEDILNMNQMEKQNNMIVMMIILYMKENIQMEKEMEKEKNIINMEKE